MRFTVLVALVVGLIAASCGSCVSAETIALDDSIDTNSEVRRLRENDDELEERGSPVGELAQGVANAFQRSKPGLGGNSAEEVTPLLERVNSLKSNTETNTIVNPQSVVDKPSTSNLPPGTETKTLTEHGQPEHLIGQPSVANNVPSPPKDFDSVELPLKIGEEKPPNRPPGVMSSVEKHADGPPKDSVRSTPLKGDGEKPPNGPPGVLNSVEEHADDLSKDGRFILVPTKIDEEKPLNRPPSVMSSVEKHADGPPKDPVRPTPLKGDGEKPPQQIVHHDRRDVKTVSAEHPHEEEILVKELKDSLPESIEDFARENAKILKKNKITVKDLEKPTSSVVLKSYKMALNGSKTEKSFFKKLFKWTFICMIIGASAYVLIETLTPKRSAPTTTADGA